MTTQPRATRSPRPVDDETRALVAEAHSRGLGRNAIARELGVPAATVSAICHAAGLSFDREQTALALRARQIDLAAERATIKAMLLLRARDALEAIDAPALVYSFGGKDNTYAERLLDAPPVTDQRNLMTIAGIALTRYADLDRVDTGATGTAEAVGMVDRMHAALTVAVEALHDRGDLPDPTRTPDQIDDDEQPETEQADA